MVAALPRIIRTTRSMGITSTGTLPCAGLIMRLPWPISNKAPLKPLIPSDYHPRYYIEERKPLSHSPKLTHPTRGSLILGPKGLDRKIAIGK